MEVSMSYKFVVAAIMLALSSLLPAVSMAGGGLALQLHILGLPPDPAPLEAAPGTQGLPAMSLQLRTENAVASDVVIQLKNRLWTESETAAFYKVRVLDRGNVVYTAEMYKNMPVMALFLGSIPADTAKVFDIRVDILSSATAGSIQFELQSRQDVAVAGQIGYEGITADFPLLGSIIKVVPPSYGLPVLSVRVLKPNGGEVFDREDWIYYKAEVINAAKVGILSMYFVKAQDVSSRENYRNIGGAKFDPTLVSPVRDGGGVRFGSNIEPGGYYYFAEWRSEDGTEYAYDFSDTPFSIVAGYILRVVSPNGGEQWEIGKTYRIQWTYTKPQALVSINIVDDRISGSGAINYVTPLGTTVAASDGYYGYYDWTITEEALPKTPASMERNNYRIMVYDSEDFTITDSSDAPFSIIAGGETEPPVPVPTPSGIRLNDIRLRTYRDKGSMQLVIMTPGVISVEASVEWSQPAPIVDVRLEQALADWALSQKSDNKGLLRIAAAGATPVLDGADVAARPLLSLVFDTSKMKPGDEFSFPLSIRMNEGPWSEVMGTVRFLPILGDVTADEEVSAFDAVRVLQYGVGLVTETDYPGLIKEVADVSGNGDISAYDAGLIMRYVAGLINEFPRESYGVAEEIKGVVSKTEASTTTASSKLAASEPARVWLGQMSSDANGYAIPVIIDRMDGVLAGQLEIGPVPDGATVEPTKLLEGYQIVTNQQNGKLFVSFAGASSPEGGGEIFRLKFATRPARLTAQVQINEDPTVTLSTAVQATSWGQIKAGFLGR